jgi:hypothetical protein
VQRIFTFLLLLFLPAVALADGRVIPTIAYPAKVTIPDQRALICFSNGTERLVIETRFTGAGTNFAWVVPLPNQPVIEPATTGLFPTLQYLFRPEIVHEIPRYWLRILVVLGLIGSFRWLIKHASVGFIAFIIFLFLFLAGALLPVLSVKSRAMAARTSAETVSILDRKLVGVFETITIASTNARALQTWLSENGYSLPPNAEPVIAGYVKDGWVFVAAKVQRDGPDTETSTPHPLSFTFRTDKPVYPMRLTGVDNGPLSVALYVFGQSRAKASHLKAESWMRPAVRHPLLQQWAAGLPVATVLAGTLSPPDLRNDVWLTEAPYVFEHRNRLYSRHAALTMALNWSVALFIGGWLGALLAGMAVEKYKIRRTRIATIAALAGVILAGAMYFCLPKTEVRLVKGNFRGDFRQAQMELQFALQDSDWKTVKQARVLLREVLADTNGAPKHWDGSKTWNSWDNFWTGGQVREEDSPGNYLLRETNHQVQLLTFDADGTEEISGAWDLPRR